MTRISTNINNKTSAIETEGPEMATRGGEREPQISFEIFGRCLKITPSTKEIPKVKIPRSTRDESIERILRKVETQRNRWNAIWSSNDQNCTWNRRWHTVCYSTCGLSAVQNSETRTCCTGSVSWRKMNSGLSATWCRTVRSTKTRKQSERTISALVEPRLADYPRISPGLSANRAERRKQAISNRLLLQSFDLWQKNNTNFHQISRAWS